MDPRRKAGVFVSLTVRALALAGALAVAVSVAAAQNAPRQVRVSAAVANVRAQPSAAGKVLFQLKQGQTARLVETAGQWHQIEDATGRRGYVFATLVEVVEPPPPPPPPPAPEAPAAAAPAAGPVTIDHKEIGCIVAEQYPKLDACFAPEDNVGRAQIHFRAQDSDPWYSVELQKDGPCFTAYLPKPMRSTKQVQYYVDVIDRSFGEKQQPDTAPQGAYHARVVRKESECGGIARLAYAVGKVAKPIVVGVARTAAGAADSGALAALGQVLLAGFRPEGVILAATGAAPAGATAAASSGAGGGSGGTAGGAGGAAGGGGIGMGTIAVVGGAVAAVGVGVAVAAGGGGSDNNGNAGGGGGGGNTTPAVVDLSGTWTGTMTLNGNIPGLGTLNCTYSQVRFAITHSGGSVTGNATFPSVTCNIPGAAPIASAGGSSPFSGTASNGQLRMSFPDPENVCPPFNLDGSYTNNSMNGNANWTCNDPDFGSITMTAAWSATR